MWKVFFEKFNLLVYFLQGIVVSNKNETDKSLIFKDYIKVKCLNLNWNDYIATATAVRAEKNIKLLDHLIETIAMFVFYVLSSLVTAIKFIVVFIKLVYIYKS
ncbi:hypothetical protein D5R40_02020 [Okeania hirsuta]|uniref:Uncharacterized protein n=1 Tax=Okeania hirsuta TaxID=1458930 RepID=A0A3N6RR81_9CYAN|nr:hypothetical protein D4Z78_08090 [Okeania hirsuta]RQH55463.1 hypothetical protein D5R40_02020 [Okeania hirsuta]